MTFASRQRVGFVDWRSFTSTWTATGSAPDIGNGTLTCRYLHVGKLIHVNFHFVAGSTTTFGTGEWRFTVPIQPVLPSTSFDFAAGEAYLENNASAGFHAHARFTDVSGSWELELLNGATNVLVTGAVPFAWGDTDFWNTKISYETDFT